MHIATALAGFIPDDIAVVRSPGHVSDEVRAAVYALPQSTHCFYCQVVLRPRQAPGRTPKGTVPGAWRTLDHVVPRCRGGRGEMANLVAACTSCNKLKGNDPLEVFLARPELAQRRRVAARHRTLAA